MGIKNLLRNVIIICANIVNIITERILTCVELTSKDNSKTLINILILMGCSMAIAKGINS